MTERLFIAEKAAVGRAIAACLGVTSQGIGFVECGRDTVTWARGHLLELAAPEEYDAKFKRWSVQDLPINPPVWKIRPTPGPGADQLRCVAKLLRSGPSEVVNVGDPDREGQRIVDAILEHVGWSGKTSRMHVQAVEPEVIRRSLRNIVDNAKHVRSGIAALCRAKADWLVGMNMSRAVTKQLSGGETVSIGRVQTPTLAMIVNRDLEVEGHVKRFYWVIEADVAGDAKVPGAGVPTKFTLAHPGRDAPRIETEREARDIAAKATAARGPIEVTRTKRAEALPALFTLGSLQRQMNKSHKWSLKRTMDTAEELYLKGITTYARTECPFLPSEHRGYVDQTIGAVSRLPELAALAGSVRTGPVVRDSIYDDTKVEEHHAIVPTRKAAAGVSLSADEAVLYAVVARRYLAALCPDREFVTTSAVLLANGFRFEGRWQTTTAAGWHRVEPPAKAETEAPRISDGQLCTVVAATPVKRAVEPPKPYTEGTLQKDMDGAAKFIVDDVLRKAMRDGESRGLGTSATQHAIVETLKARGFVVLADGCLRSTPFGRSVIMAVPPSLYDIGLTARWEQALDKVAKGGMTDKEFMDRTSRMIDRFLADVRSRANGPRIVGAKVIATKSRRGRASGSATGRAGRSAGRSASSATDRSHRGA
ncbi:MAG: DNA topoisomerase [Acidiphilium sp.]|nr:DNA topoisomerase [Acidiphilium sp.]